MIRSTRCLIFGALIVLSPCHVLAQSTIDPTTITRIAVDQNGDVFVRSAAAAPASGAPACATSPDWNYMFTSTTAVGAARLAAAMSAKLTGRPVRLIGTGVCYPGYNVETLAIVDVK